MSAELRLLLRSMLADPSKLRELPPEEERALLASLRAVVGDEPPPPPVATPAVVAPAGSPDDLLTVAEAAAMLRVSPRWIYRHAKGLSFARKLSRKVLRFSRSGIARWLATKRL